MVICQLVHVLALCFYMIFNLLCTVSFVSKFLKSIVFTSARLFRFYTLLSSFISEL
jgi:hypothetical protein